MISNRYNQDGSENLDFWFGKKEDSVSVIGQVSITHFSKPRYVRYTMAGLKKRSTKRLETMHYNLFSKTDTRQNMITRLYQKLNYMWDNFQGTVITKEVDRFGFEFIPGMNVPGMTVTTKKRGRKQMFETHHCYHIIADYELGDMNLTQVAKKWNTNIATVSNIVNGKGTYANLFEG